ncbi:TIGR02710 family CRISPR-associated CARF protein [candidate division KSB1 bacterium]
MKKSLLISLGGATAPVVVSIKYHKPEYLLFYTSKQTQKHVPTVLEAARGFFGTHDSIVTQSSDEFDVCFETLYRGLPRKMKLYGISRDELIVDFTGGTKNMSAAMALATAEFTRQFSYVGGKERTKEGTGIVIDGEEYVEISRNPWDVMAIPIRKRVGILFNKARFASARYELEMIKDNVSPHLKRLYGALSDIISGFYYWDNFMYSQAVGPMNKGVRELCDYAKAAGENTLDDWGVHVKKLFPHIEELRNQQSNNEFKDEFIIDLISNAQRRAVKENKFDDAVARLYSCIERIAKIRLLREYKLNNSKIRPEDLPISIREDFKKRFYDRDDKCIKIGLYHSYQLLDALNDPVGTDFMKRYKHEIKPLLKTRNFSPLAHGIDPIKQNTYDKFFRQVCNLYGIDESHLTMFPDLEM